MMEFFRASESLLYPLASTHAINMYQLEHICFDWEISFENQIWCYFSTHSWLFFLCWLWITTESLTFSFLLWSKIMLGIWFRSLIVYILLWIKFHDRLVTVKHPYMPEHIHYWIQYNSGRSMKSWLCFTELYINVLAGLRQAVLWFQLSRGSMEPIWFVEGAERLSGSGSSVGWQPQRRSCRRWRHAPCCSAVPTAQTKSQGPCLLR
jgi:hypothetical protein